MNFASVFLWCRWIWTVNWGNLNWRKFNTDILNLKSLTFNLKWGKSSSQTSQVEASVLTTKLLSGAIFIVMTYSIQFFRIFPLDNVAIKLKNVENCQKCYVHAVLLLFLILYFFSFPSIIIHIKEYLVSDFDNCLRCLSLINEVNVAAVDHFKNYFKIRQK